MIVAILVILILLGVMVIRRLDFLVYAATEGRYNPWYWRIKDFLFNDGPIFRP